MHAEAWLNCRDCVAPLTAAMTGSAGPVPLGVNSRIQA